MEAKVDIRKLQLLNDRITQTIDALNQVRLSVHGLGHTSPSSQVNPSVTGGLGGQTFGQQPFGQQQPWTQFGGQPSIGQPPGMGMNPFQTGSMGGFGMQHSNPYTQNPLQQLSGQGGGSDFIENQYLLARASDPSRIGSTFPFAFQPQPPVLGL
jgi:hypothetical protein